MVRGYGLGVQWNDVPGILINRRGVSREVASLRIELEASRTVIEKLQDETAKKDEEMQAVKAQLNGIDARLHTPLESILSGGVDGINKLIDALTQLAREKQVEAISHGMHAVANPDNPCSTSRIRNHHVSPFLKHIVGIYNSSLITFIFDYGLCLLFRDELYIFLGNCFCLGRSSNAISVVCN